MSDKTLIERIFENPDVIDTLTDDEQEQLLVDYQTLSEHWVSSPNPAFQALAREILWLLEAAGIEIDVPQERRGKTLH